MKILCGPDLHIRVRAPEHRIDNFVETQKHKIKWMLEFAWLEQCKLILLPGDITDHSRLPYHIIDHYIRSFKRTFDGRPQFEILAVRGQHDMLYHVESENTPISVMDASEALFIVENNTLIETTKEELLISGVSWGQEIPDPADDIVNILLIHKMFVADKLWEGQEEYEQANIFLRKSKWDLIVSGDNHQHFMFHSKGRFHVNCGSLMRQNIDQVGHRPVVYIYDTVDKTLCPHYIPLDPIAEVMDLEKAQEDKKQSEELQAFVESIQETTEIEGLDFVSNLNERLNQDDISDGMRKLGEEIMRKAGENL